MAKSAFSDVVAFSESTSRAYTTNNAMSCKCAATPALEKRSDTCYYSSSNNNNCSSDDDNQYEYEQQLESTEAALAAWEAQGCGEQRDSVAQVLEVIRLGLEKEAASTFVRDCDYMKETQRHGLKNAWRVKICRWMFETGKAFDLSVDTIGCAIAYMDQFLCAESVDKVMMQLLSLVCVLCASKMHDPEPLSLDELSLLCEARFAKSDMCRVEMHLLRVLNWELNPPNTFTFARDFVHALALPDTDAVVKSVTELLAFVAEDYTSVRCKPSSVALAAVQIVLGAQTAAPKLAQLSVASGSTDEFLAAVELVQRVHAATYASNDTDDNGDELACDASAQQLGVSRSPVAVENHPTMNVMADIVSLQQLLKTQALAAEVAVAASTPPSPTQRELFTSPGDKQHASTKKRSRTASLSLAH